jgi:hypothetical protein
MRVRVFALVVLAAAFGATAVTAGTPATAGKPSTAVVKRLLAAHYTNHDYATRKYSIIWKVFQFGAPRVGTHRADGTPPNTKTIVYPVRVQFVRTTSYPTLNEKKVELIKGEYVFFKDEFGAWIFTLKNEQIIPR